jgi:hypothetical protein
MTLTTTTRARSFAKSSAPRISLRRSLFVIDPRTEPRDTPRHTWIGALVVRR